MAIYTLLRSKIIKVEDKVWFRLACVMPLNRIVLGERVGDEPGFLGGWQTIIVVEV